MWNLKIWVKKKEEENKIGANNLCGDWIYFRWPIYCNCTRFFKRHLEWGKANELDGNSAVQDHISGTKSIWKVAKKERYKKKQIIKQNTTRRECERKIKWSYSLKLHLFLGFGLNEWTIAREYTHYKWFAWQKTEQAKQKLQRIRSRSRINRKNKVNKC